MNASELANRVIAELLGRVLTDLEMALAINSKHSGLGALKEAVQTLLGITHEPEPYHWLLRKSEADGNRSILKE